MMREKLKAHQHKLISVFGLIICIILAAGIEARASGITKVSREVQKTETLGDTHTSTITVNGDASPAFATSTFMIAGVGGFSSNSSIIANSMYLECPDGGAHVPLTHVEIPIKQGGEGTNLYYYFDSTQVTGFDASGLDLVNNEYWCTLVMQETVSWTFPNAMRLDRIRPKIDSGKLITYPMTAHEDGKVKWTWYWNDPGCPGDPDGLNGNQCNQCSDEHGTNCYLCNKSTSKYAVSVFRRKKPALYDPMGGIAGFTSAENTSLTNTIPNVSQDRFKISPDAYCYIWRVEDTAGNFSVRLTDINIDADTLASEKCIIPDDRLPVFEGVEYYKDPYNPATGFSGQFPMDAHGKPLLTSNACLFDPPDANPDDDCTTLTDRIIEMKIVVDEPLFDAQGRYGANWIAGDGFDNDNDGYVDEEPGGFNNIDDDAGGADGLIDEDVAAPAGTSVPAIDDSKDNDTNGYVDEIPRSVAGVDSSSYACTDGYLYNFHQGVCVDKPRIRITGSSEGAVPSNDNPDDTLKFICTQDGVTTSPDCQGLNYGETVYRFSWNVSGPLPPIGLEEGDYSIKLSGSDGVGNFTELAAPTVGADIYMDNTPPTISIDYFSNNNYSATFTTGDHDNNSGTPKMPVVKEGMLYIGLLASEELGATPTQYIFLPDLKNPTYEGRPQSDVYATTTTFYPTCGQSLSCDYCTGDNCNAYDPVSLPCKSFRSCFNVDSATTNNGYAGVTVVARDRLYNQKWSEYDYEAAADPNDANKLSDDTYHSSATDGVPNYSFCSTYTTQSACNADSPTCSWSAPLAICLTPGIPGLPEPDTDITVCSTHESQQDCTIDTQCLWSEALSICSPSFNDGQFFAIDYSLPATPAISLPIAPCNGIVARLNKSCATTAQAVNNPVVSWTPLNDGLDNDGDGSTDEECVDGADDDLDGTIDEDGRVCSYTGTANWEIKEWRLQVAKDSDFNSDSLIVNSIVVGTSKQMPVLDQRSLTEHYYWRIAPTDKAGNIGPYNPTPNTMGTTQPYFTFDIDTVAPKLAVEYFSDTDCSVPLPVNQSGIPITGDTMDNATVVCVRVTSNEDVATGSIPTFVTLQSGTTIDTISTQSDPVGSMKTFKATFEVDAKGSGQKYQNGQVQLLFTTSDPYGNAYTNHAAATGSIFIVDATAAEASCSAEPHLASNDNDHDGVSGELVDDAVKISCHLSKYIGDSFHVRVKQPNFAGSPGIDDGLDNDCDGRIDEETSSSTDLDGDGLSGEDTGASQKSGSGCYILLTMETGSTYDYKGAYNVVPTYYEDPSRVRKANIILGDTDSGSKYYIKDFAGNPIYATGTFDIDTVPPTAPTLSQPSDGKILSTNTPQISWNIGSRDPYLFKYGIEISTSNSFPTLAAQKEKLDDGHSSTFFTTILAGDTSTGLPLADNQYYWRVFSYDDALNKSSASPFFTFHVDTLPPGPPVFDDEEATTQATYSLLSGYTSPAEKNAFVNIYVNNVFLGQVTTDSDGKFTLNGDKAGEGIDDDGDGSVNEDPIDGIDNDFDGSTDEDPPGIFLTEGDNVIEGQIIDAGGNRGTRGCDPATPFYDSGLSECILTHDSGAPMFTVAYYSDPSLTAAYALPTNSTTGKQTAKAGTVYALIISTEDLPGTPTFTVDFQGASDKGVTPTTSIASSKRRFTGSFAVTAESAPQYIDGDAKFVAIGVDAQNNRTATGTLPLHGGYLTIDTKPPSFSATFWKNSTLQDPVEKSNLIPITKAGDFYIGIRSNEPMGAAPTVSINQPGASDTSSAATTAVDSTGMYFKYDYIVHGDNGSSYVDGLAVVSINGSDVVGNTTSSAVPDPGSIFRIDTTPPDPPNITDIPTETKYTQIQVSGCVEDGQGNDETGATVQFFNRLKVGTLAADDGIDNDGDGRIDEEPGGANGIDDDHDSFIDEDYTTHTCGTNQLWDYEESACFDISPNSTPTPDGEATTNSTGCFTTTVSGIMAGVDYISCRAIDIAGNVSETGAVKPVIGLQTEAVTLTHEFTPGWHLVGIPHQPSVLSPSAALQLYNNDFFQLKNDVYVYNSGLDPARPGKCYWVYFPSTETAVSPGVTSNTNSVQISAGWNMVAVPYNKSVVWNSDMQVQANGQTYTVGTTDADYYVDSEIYFYNSETNVYEASGVSDGKEIEPWIGFMIYAHQSCSLIFPSQYDIEE
jgi:hypothetical protein